MWTLSFLYEFVLCLAWQIACSNLTKQPSNETIQKPTTMNFCPKNIHWKLETTLNFNPVFFPKLHISLFLKESFIGMTLICL